MKPPRPHLFIDRLGFLKRAGAALIAVGLILLTMLTMSPGFRIPLLAGYSYVLLVLGGIAVLLFKGLEIIQYSQLRNRTSYCLDCGWFGPSQRWYRHRCCPECDSENVMMQGQDRFIS